MEAFDLDANRLRRSGARVKFVDEHLLLFAHRPLQESFPTIEVVRARVRASILSRACSPRLVSAHHSVCAFRPLHHPAARPALVSVASLLAQEPHGHALRGAARDPDAAAAPAPSARVWRRIFAQPAAAPRAPGWPAVAPRRAGATATPTESRVSACGARLDLRDPDRIRSVSN